MNQFKTTSLADQVFEKLENDIIQGVYPRGEILTELKLVDQLGVSRTPIREALRRLEQERLIEDTGKGSRVVGITEEDLEDIMNIRQRIEGLAAYYACNFLTLRLIRLLVPGFTNYNDAVISAMSRSGRYLMVVSTVILVPPAEECVFRGLIFRNLYGKSRWVAYVVSILAFAAIHVLGFIGKYSALELVMAVLQYLPAGLSLAWAYTKSDTIFAPIIIHACINLVAIGGLW